MNFLQRFYEKKRVLVTGGAGFIGSHLVEKLVSLGAIVTVLDNFSTGQLNNLKSVVSSIKLLCADIRSPYTSMKATANQDVVFHLASFVSVPGSVNNPDLCYNININGTMHLLEGCKKNNVSSFVFSSSSAVYGNKNGICSEDDAPAPQSPYAISKREAEAICKDYASESNMNLAILRYFNVYGPRQNPQGPYAAVVAKFTEQLLAKQPLTIFGDGTQTRDFVDVSKAIEANLTLGAREDLKGEVFNIGSGKSITLLQLINQLEKELNIEKTGISFLPARQGDILFSQASCEKYKKMGLL